MLKFSNPRNHIVRLKSNIRKTPHDKSNISTDSTSTNSYIYNDGEDNNIGSFLAYSKVHGNDNTILDKNEHIMVYGSKNTINKGCRHIFMTGQSHVVEDTKYHSVVHGFGAISNNSGEHVVGTPFGDKSVHKTGRSQLNRILLCASVDDRGISTLNNFYDLDYLHREFIRLPTYNTIARVKLEFVIRSSSSSNQYYACGHATNIVSSNNIGITSWNASNKFNITYDYNTFPSEITIEGDRPISHDNTIKINISNGEGNGEITMLSELTIISLSS